MDYESSESREKGCWDPKTSLRPFYETWDSATPTPDFVVDEVWRGLVSSVGFGTNPSAETLSFWDETLKQVYSGDEGRKKLRNAVANLLERDGLLLRLRDVKCPVYWLQVCHSSFLSHHHILTPPRALRTPSLARMSLLSTSSSSPQAPKLRSPLLMVLATT